MFEERISIRIRGHILLDYINGIVGRTTIDNDVFYVSVSLRSYRCNSPFKTFCIIIIYGYD